MIEADIILANKTFDETTSDGRTAKLIWANFYSSFERVISFIIRSQEQPDDLRKKDFEMNACSAARGLPDLLYVVPKSWENNYLFLNVGGKIYRETYAGAERRLYSYIAKYFEYYPEEGPYRDPLYRHFPCNRILRNNTPPRKENPWMF